MAAIKLPSIFKQLTRHSRVVRLSVCTRSAATWLHVSMSYSHTTSNSRKWNERDSREGRYKVQSRIDRDVISIHVLWSAWNYLSLHKNFPFSIFEKLTEQRKASDGTCILLWITFSVWCIFCNSIIGEGTSWLEKSGRIDHSLSLTYTLTEASMLCFRKLRKMCKIRKICMTRVRGILVMVFMTCFMCCHQSGEFHVYISSLWTR